MRASVLKGMPVSRVLLIVLPIVAGVGGDAMLLGRFPSEPMDVALLGSLVAQAAIHVVALLGIGAMLFSVAQMSRRVVSWLERTSEFGVVLGAALGLAVFDQLAFGAAFTAHRSLVFLRVALVGGSGGVLVWRLLRPAHFLTQRRWLGFAGVALALLLLATIVSFGASLFPITPKYLREPIQALALGLAATAWLLFVLSSPALSQGRCFAILAVGLALFLGGAITGSVLSYRSTSVVVTTTEFVRSLRNANRQFARMTRLSSIPGIRDLVGAGKTPMPVIGDLGSQASCSRAGTPRARSVLLLTFDALRADFYGVPPLQRPHFEELAASSQVFTNAIQTTSGTSGSIFSHHVGRYPDQPSPTRDLLPTVARTLGLHYFYAVQGYREPNAQFTDKIINQLKAAPTGFLVHAHYLALHLPKGLLRSHHHYPEIVRQLDSELGRILQALDGLGLRDQTLLIVTADHGEELLHERGYESHGYGNTQTLLHTPLLVRAPGFPHARHDELVSGADVLPTILDALGARCSCRAHGQTLLAVGDRGREGPIFASSMAPNPAVAGLYYSDIHSVFLGSWKLVLNRAENAVALYRLDVDPHERRNLADQEPARVAGMTALLAQHLGDRQ